MEALMSVQKKVIFGDVALLQADAAVVPEIIVMDYVVILPGETYWGVPIEVVLWVPGVGSFAARFRIFTEQVRGEDFCDTGEVLTCDDRYLQYSKEINRSPRVEAVRKAIRVATPQLQDFIIDQYLKGGVSLDQIIEYLTQHCEALRAPNMRKSRKKAA